jgi:hypothetical protein
MGDLLSQTFDIITDLEALSHEYIKLGRLEAEARIHRLIKTGILSYLGLSFIMCTILQASLGFAALFVGLWGADIEKWSRMTVVWQTLLGASVITGFCACFCLFLVFQQKSTANPVN